MTNPRHLALGTTALGLAGCAACCAAPVAAATASTVFAPVAGAAALTAFAMTALGRHDTDPVPRPGDSNMTTDPRTAGRLRAALAALLIVAAALFAIGVAREHSTHHTETSSDSTTTHTETGADGDGGESAPASVAHTEASAESRVLGVDVESWPIVALVAALSLALALGVLRVRTTPFVAVAAAFAAIAAVFDVAEVIHQVNDSQTLLAAIAIAVGALHVGALAAAVALMRRPWASPA